MKRSHILLFCIVLSVVLGSCSLLGIHLKVHNPKNPGKPHKYTDENILLGEMTKYRDCFDVYYYDLSVELDPSNELLMGTVEIHSKAQKDFDRFQIDLHSNFQIEGITDKITGESLNYTREERAIYIDNTRKKDESFTIEVRYSGKPVKAKKAPWKGGFVWKKDKERNPWVGVACETDGASIWWPLKDHTSDEPDSMRMHYTVPEGLIAVGNGRFEGEVASEHLTTFNWFVSYPINTYNVTVYVGDFKMLKDEYIGISGEKLELTHYVLERNYEKAKKHFQQVHPMLKIYEQKFGEYPWFNDGFKLIESPYEGMEHQTAIAYGNGYKNDIDPVTDYILLHELAHEWWGNSITAKDLADVWLQEGFATYAEALYFEEKNGKDKYDQHLYFNKIFIKNKYPVVGEKNRRWFHFRKSSDAYVKGAWVLQSLRVQMENDSLFFDIIKSFYDRHKYKIVESNDFIEIVNEKTGEDYQWFFNQYLYNNFAPEFEYGVSLSGSLYYRWNNVSEDFDKLKVRMKSQGKIIELSPSTKVQKLVLPKTAYGAWNIEFLGRENGLIAFKENKRVIDVYMENKINQGSQNE